MSIEVEYDGRLFKFDKHRVIWSDPDRITWPICNEFILTLADDDAIVSMFVEDGSLVIKSQLGRTMYLSGTHPMYQLRGITQKMLKDIAEILENIMYAVPRHEQGSIVRPLFLSRSTQEMIYQLRKDAEEI